MPPVVPAQLDYYALLGITQSFDTAEVNAVLRRLVWRYHPDRNHAPGATLQFQDINEAHQVLSDPARRADYDAKWQPPRREADRNEFHRPRHLYGRYRRRWHGHRNVRNILLIIFALLFVSSAWADISAL